MVREAKRFLCQHDETLSTPRIRICPRANVLYVDRFYVDREEERPQSDVAFPMLSSLPELVVSIGSGRRLCFRSCDW
eukprot:6394803-Amphidinium_carterae.1